MRKMTIEDYDQVYALWNSSSGVDTNDIDESKEAIEVYLQRNPETCFVEEKDGKIIGVIMGGHDGRRGGLHHLIVAEGYRKHGVGRSLVKECCEALKKQGIRRIGLFVYNDNEVAKAFWAKQGLSIRDDIIYLDKDL